jgi:hypothetical protein
LDKGASVNCPTNDDGRMPLHTAAALGTVEMVQLLLRRGASINRKTDTGATALTTALSKQYSEVVRLLLNNGAAVSVGILEFAAQQAVPEDVLLVVAALGPAADADVLSNACESAAQASRMENVAVLLKQLCSVDPAAMQRVFEGLWHTQDVAAACVTRWLVEAKSVTEQQQQQLNQQQRQFAAEPLAVQQLVVAAAGMHRQAPTERQMCGQHADVEASVPEARRRGSWARARQWLCMASQ